MDILSKEGLNLSKKEFKRVSALIRADAPICRNCAQKYGAEWPEGHCASCWTDLCAFCGQHTGLCAASDWEWKGELRRYMCSREF